MNIERNRRFPGPIYAFIWGREIRREFTEGFGSVYERRKSRFNIIWGEKPHDLKVDVLSGVVVLTHLQYKSPFGIFTSFRPFQFHFWLMWQEQKTEMRDGVMMRIPNSERGIYFRLPGWRWDLEKGMIRTGGRVPGAHWD